MKGNTTMLFTSSAFLFFLAVLIAVYNLTPRNYRWIILLVGSMTFYGFAGPHFLLYICATIIVSYFCILRISRIQEEKNVKLSETDDRELKREIRARATKTSRRWMIVCLIIVLGILGTVKYTDFVIANTNSILAAFGFQTRFGFMRFALPMGISFYTFQTVGYVVDIYREKAAPTRNIFKLALFVSFFPQVIQGPISRFSNIGDTLYSGISITRHSLSRGSMRILWGFFKKLVIADRLWPALEVLLSRPDEFQGAFYLFSIGLYALILFCDFTGGIDITIGIAEIFGIRLPENFNRPFYSRSIQEFWQRWHITMGTWFRDYVFYPISVSKRMLRFSKWSRTHLGEGFGKRLPLHISIICVWFVTGLWHGATWNFIAWGLANGIVIILSVELAPLYQRFHKFLPGAVDSRVYKCFAIFRTFWLMNVIRSFDIYEGVGFTFSMMGSVFTNFGASDFMSRGVSELTLHTYDYIAAGAGLLVVLWASWLSRDGVDFRDKMATFFWPIRYAIVGLIIFMVLILGAYGIGYDARQFIYNQF